ncbi:hypothetical protein [Lysinibacillus antri]|uniref:Uncharacterized protein n=1 Tax=Lysinibacillus antri TaxID=2498145 RepID=A0A432L8K5_9BACI|nr:hypothetical protein [Lysinibacillus antri]RUL48803.1 hypothetical protein EK386_16335 [Lysinibacillus antri]
MNLFQLKSKPHGTERLPLFLEEKFIAIGWPGIGDLTNVDADEIERRLASTYEKYKGQTMAYHKGMVNAFVNTMQSSDIVMITEGDYVHIGQVGEYFYDPAYDNDEGMCHRRPVEWLATVERSYLNEQVREHLKNRATITKFKYPFQMAEIEPYLLGNKSNPSPTVPKGEIYEKAWDILVKALDSEEEHIRVLAASAIWKS